QAQCQTLLNRERGFHTITAVAIPHSEAQGDAAISTDPETEEHLFEISTAVFAVSISRAGRRWDLRGILIGAIEHNSRSVLMEPGRRNGIDLQRFESDRVKHRVEIGGKQRIEDVPQAVVME